MAGGRKTGTLACETFYGDGGAWQKKKLPHSNHIFDLRLIRSRRLRWKAQFAATLNVSDVDISVCD